MLGIFNRKYAMEFLTKSEKTWTSFSVVMIDIDGFKSVNATYGHEFADDVLKIAANRLKALKFETQSILARYGGDQFMMILDELLTEEHPSLKATPHKTRLTALY